MTADDYVQMVLDPTQSDEDVAEAFFEIDLEGMSKAQKSRAINLAVDALRQHRPGAYGMIPGPSLRALLRELDDDA
jgi:hypothetical protein